MIGEIRNLQRYIRAKLLNHKEWTKLLPNNITPSDIDMTLDNDGRILQMELSSQTSDWKKLSIGQRRLQESYVRIGAGKITSVLVKHREPQEGAQIDTISDVEEFSVMLWRNGQIVSKGPYNGSGWPKFIDWWWSGKK